MKIKQTLQFIEDAMRRDTAAPSILGLGVSCSVSASGACRFMLAVPLVGIVRSCLNLADLCSCSSEPYLFIVDLIKNGESV